MGKMTLHQGVLRRSITTNTPPNRKRGRIVMPGPGPNKPPFSISRLDEILKGDSKPRFCIVRSLGGIGDVLMTTPLCRGLKKKWPGAHVTYATDKDYMNGALVDILKYNPFIDEIIPHQTIQGKKFDGIADVSSVCTGYEKRDNPPINRIDLFSHASGIPLFGDRLPVYIVTDEEKRWAQEFLAKKSGYKQGMKWVGIQAKSNSARRDWPIEYVKELAARLGSLNNIGVVVFDHDSKEIWNIVGVTAIKNFKIRLVGALVDAMDIMICHDSGLLHIAGALEKRIIGLFGSTHPLARINYYDYAIAIENESLRCLHCWYASCEFKYFCMKSITVDEVYEQTLKHLRTECRRDNQINMSAPNEKTVVLRRDVGGLGDMISITPILRGLRERFTNKQIHLMIPDQYKDIFDNNPNVDKIMLPNDVMFKYYKNRYDISSVCAKYEVERLKNNKSVDKSRIEIFCQETGVNPSRYRPELYLTDEEKDWAREFLKSYNDNFIIATAVRSSEKYRDWPLEHYQQVFDYFEKKFPEVKFLILDHERKWNFKNTNIIDGAGFPFRKYIALAHRAHMVLTPDTSLLHVAGAFNKKTLALFGPIDPASRCKLFPKTEILIDKKLSCVSCWRNSYIPCELNNDLDKSVCMYNISPQLVCKKIKKILRGRR